MAVHFLARTPKILAKRELIDGNKTVVAPAAFTAVPGTRMKVNVLKYSVIEIQIQGAIEATAAANLGLDLAITSGGVTTRLGQALGLETIGVLLANINLALPIAFSVWLDNLAEGEHTVELQVLASAGNALLHAAAASVPLRITVVEHPAIYPPPGVD